jgi:ubiquinone/menaquinone biosynthesis C-methylase UbiE
MANSKTSSQPSALVSETERIREIFTHRKDPGEGPLDLFRLYEHQGRQQALVRFFREIGLTSLKGLRILDVGCGSGGPLQQLNDFGADAEECFGIDLFHARLACARRQFPNISFVEGSAAQLPFASAEFDLIFQFTVFTSVLDSEIRRAIASEVRRALRPGGYFICYDFAYCNPKNPNVRGIRRREISELLSGFDLRFQKLTLAPPIGRRAAKISPLLYQALAAVPLLRTHYFCFAHKP